MRPTHALALIATVFAAGAAHAREADLARVPVRIVEGRLVVFCDVSTSFRRLPVNLFVELDTPSGLVLHNKAAGPLRAEIDGHPVPVTIHLPGLEIEVPQREHGDEELLDDFTKYHSKELGENAVVGSIGSAILKRYHLALDLDQGLMFLGPAREHADDVGPIIADPDAMEVPVTLTNDLVWLPVKIGEGAPMAIALTTSRYDSLVERRLADGRGRPAGDVGPVVVRDLDLAPYVAFRPEEVDQVHADGVFGTLGINALEHLLIEVDRENRRAWIRPTRKPEFPEADLAYFRALVEDEADALVSYLDAWPDARLSGEAARRLLDLRLDEEADDAAIQHALELLSRNRKEDLRATAGLDLMTELLEAGFEDAGVAAGKLGVESGRKDRYPNAVHEIHSKLGQVLFDRGEGKEAWRHLLSAAFGIPEDGMVNLYLGLFYESEGRDARAFSRFVQAVIKPESGPRAFEGLTRVAARLPGDERMSVDTIDRLIAGKVLNFGTATRYKPDPGKDTNRVVLCELFTNAHLKPALAGALGNEGLLHHFPREKVAMISWHLPSPQMEPLVNDMALRRAEDLMIRQACHRINGAIEGPGAARTDQREALYEYVRDQVKQQLAVPSDYTMTMNAALEGAALKGELVVRGPKRWGRRVYVVLVEKGVLFPGRNEAVIHRMVGRASIAGGLEGVRFKADEDDAMTIPFTADLKAIAAENRACLERLAAEGRGATVPMSIDIDPGQVQLVAFVRDVADNQVLQAIAVDPVRGEESP